MNALWNANDLDAPATCADERTVSASQKRQNSLVHLGIITYELLGGKAGTFTPLVSVSEEGNKILRDCLTSGSNFPTARDFYTALSNTANARAMPLSGGSKPFGPGRAQTSHLERPPSKSALPGSAPSANPVSRPTSTSKKNAPLIAATLVCVFIMGGLGWFFVATSFKPTLAPLTATTSPSPAPAAVHRMPPQPGKPWTNSLEMRFVPLGDIYFAVWQTRVHDFEAFVQATGYDAIGGMSSVVIQNGFKLNDMSWKNPGFVQTSEHPVIGVSWEDANQFCAWLTRKERSEGTLTAFQSYRLPTDREWSEAVGLADEPCATPEERSGKIKGVYPWGSRFPPSVDASNYAGAESRADAQETWTVIEGFHDSFPRTAPISAFKANARGLCSLGGNVWEWCIDKYNRTMTWRTLRGGSWATSRAEEMLSSYRRGYDPLFRCDDVGFRCVIAVGGGQK